MPITTANDIALLHAANTAYDALFDFTFKGMDTTQFYAPFCRDIPAVTKAHVHDWVTGTPATRKWTGPKAIRTRTTGHELVGLSQPWEATMGVGKWDMAADHLGLLRPNIAMLSEEAGQFPGRRFTSILADNAAFGDSFPTTIDGVAYFSDQHTYLMEGAAQGTYWSNISTLPFSAKNLETARIEMMLYKDGEGRFLGKTPTHLVIPAILQPDAERALKSMLRPGTSLNDTNVIRDYGLTLVVNPYIPATTKADAPWFLFDLSGIERPFIFQHLSMPQLVYVEDPTNPSVFINGMYLYGYEAHYDFLPAFPQVGWGSFPGEA